MIPGRRVLSDSSRESCSKPAATTASSFPAEG